MKILLISDFFYSDLLYGGGAEYNDKILIELLKKNVDEVNHVRSVEVDEEFISKLDKDTKIIVSNFINLSEQSKDYIERNHSYIIYEHDHKYLKRRIPSLFYNLKAPKSEIMNYSFYKGAKAVFAQSSFHKKIIEMNIDIENIINLSGNLWSLEDFKKIKSNLNNEKKDKYSILDSHFPGKGTQEAIEYCNKNDLEYELVKDENYYNFLKKISKNKTLIFLPKIPETLSRICIEARMMGCNVTTNGYVGAKYEEWFSNSPSDIIKEMESVREKILENTLRLFQ